MRACHHEIKWPWACLTCLLLFVGLALIWRGARRSQPSDAGKYLGKPLGYWIDRLPVTIPLRAGNQWSYATSDMMDLSGSQKAASGRGVRDSGIAAVRDAGTNGLPLLVYRIGGTDPPWKVRLADWMSRNKVGRFAPPLQTKRREQAITAFMILGTNALPAVAALKQQKDSASADSNVVYAATFVLDNLRRVSKRGQ